MVNPIKTDELDIDIRGEILIIKAVTSEGIYFRHEDESKNNYLIGHMTMEEFNNNFKEV